MLRNLAAALDAGLAVTLLAEPRHYAALARVLDELPPGPLLFNHLGLPSPDTDRRTWRDTLGRLVRRPQTYVQLSGLPFLFGDTWRTPDAQSLLDEAFDIFGPQRLVFASDWPMLLRFARYGDWVAPSRHSSPGARPTPRPSPASSAAISRVRCRACCLPRTSHPSLQPTTEQHA